MHKKRSILKELIQEIELYQEPFPENGTREEVLSWAHKANLHDDKERDRVKKEQKEKFNILLNNKQDIDELDFETALTVAQACHRGFNVKPSSKKPGAIKKWNDYVLAFLWVEVEYRVKCKLAKTKKAALYQLCIEAPWKQILLLECSEDEDELDLKYEQLRKKYHTARKTPIIVSYANQNEEDKNLDELKDLLGNIIMPVKPAVNKFS